MDLRPDVDPSKQKVISDRSFLIKHPDKSYGRVTTDENYDHPSIEPSVDIAKNGDLQEVARQRGWSNIKRLASLAPEQLDGEIGGLKKLRSQQIEGLKAVYGDTGTALAKEWMRRGSILADSGNDRNYRSRAKASFPSLGKTDDSRIKLSGWDETVQTSIVRERVRGRRTALGKFSKHSNFKKLEQIHHLMTQSSSLSRVPTAGVAGSLDAVDGTFGAHTTAKKLSGGGVGTNPMAHRYRTEFMQETERRLHNSNPHRTMADLQRVRLASSLSMTANNMSAKSIPDVTNKEVFSRARSPERKAAAMHWGREAAKTMQRAIAPKNNRFVRAPSPPNSPTATRKTVARYR